MKSLKAFKLIIFRDEKMHRLIDVLAKLVGALVFLDSKRIHLTVEERLLLSYFF